MLGNVDVEGMVYNEAGLDVESLLQSRSASGGVDRAVLRPEDQLMPASEWLGMPVDLVVPAAVSYCIDATNQHLIQARLIVEAANMPVTPEAEERLNERGIVVTPDFVANSATNAWWWWVFFGDVDGTAEQSFDKIAHRMLALTDELFEQGQANGSTLRAAGLELATAKLSVIEKSFPTFLTKA